MTRWMGHRGQCLLCHYGLRLKTPAKARTYATSFTSTIRAKSLKKSAWQEEREERWIEKQLSSGHDPGFELTYTSSLQKSFRLRRHKNEDPERSQDPECLIPDTPDFGSSYKSFKRKTEKKGTPLNLLSLLEECIPIVWQESDTDNYTELLKDLDPTGDVWSKYINHIRQLLAFPTSQLNRNHKKMHTDLVASLSTAAFLHNTTRLLRFSFFDHALELQGFTFEKVLEHIPDMQNPTEWYPKARQTQRQIHLHVGPTNSGKTYNALKQLEAANSGYYAGPLRLLAHEVYSRFRAKGILCDLVTGDDIRMGDETGTHLVSSTVEMVNLQAPCDVAVIDEIQMIADEERGWAWTRALLGTTAREVHLCGEARVVPLIQELAATMGDNLQIHRYERLNPLKAMSKSLRGDLKNLQKGDCVVSFSVVNIHAMKKQIEKDTGRHAAIVYGSLPPEVRAQQAALFNDPDNDYDFLVASDAIGMGLNLSIKRIIFETVAKHNGVSRERISISQAKQIAGRAGRFKTARDETNKASQLDGPQLVPKEDGPQTVGLVTCLDERDLPFIREALSTEAPPIKSAGLLPPGQNIDETAIRLPHGLPFEYLYKRTCEAATVNRRYHVCDIRSQLSIARTIESVKGLTIEDRIMLIASPAVTRNGEGDVVTQALARCIAAGTEVTVADVPEIPLEILEKAPIFDRSYLVNLEVLHKSLILYLWLAYRFQGVFKDMDMAFHAKELAEEKINFCLTKFSANPKLTERLKEMQNSFESSPDGEKEDPNVSGLEGDVTIGESREEAPKENESSELDLAMAELEQVAVQAEDSMIDLTNNSKSPYQTNSPRRSASQSVTDPELHREMGHSSNDFTPPSGPAETVGNSSSTETQGLDIDVTHVANITVTPTTPDRNEPSSTPTPITDDDMNLSPAPSESPGDDKVETQKKKKSQIQWTPGNNEARPVFIPTNDQPRENDTPNTTR